MRISFVVPTYNVAPYLRKCVDSLIHQDYEDYEIILVDDGSTDGSGAICDEYGRMYDVSMYDVYKKCIRVVHQQNAGLSAARNVGIKTAEGEYICFVDSDDYWEENVLGGLMEQVERDNLDVLRFNYQNINEKYEVFEPNKTPRYIDTKNNVVDGETYLNTRMGYACYAVMYIMRRDLVPTFAEGIHFEDTEWLPRMMLRAKRVNSATTVVYNYLVRQGSITQVKGNTDKVRQNVDDSMKVIAQYNEYIVQYPDCTWLNHMRSSMVVSVLSNVALYIFGERKEYIKRLKTLGVFPLGKAPNQSQTYICKARLMNVSPLLAVDLLHIKNGKQKNYITSLWYATGGNQDGSVSEGTASAAGEI